MSMLRMIANSSKPEWAQPKFGCSSSLVNRRRRIVGEPMKLQFPKDHDEALKGYRLAAAQGDAVAQTYLGRAYRDGRDVPKDYDEAVKWYRLAAAQGVAVAQANLGRAYQNGWGVPKDYDEAVK